MRHVYSVHNVRPSPFPSSTCNHVARLKFTSIYLHNEDIYNLLDNPQTDFTTMHERRIVSATRRYL